MKESDGIKIISGYVTILLLSISLNHPVPENLLKLLNANWAYGLVLFGSAWGATQDTYASAAAVFLYIVSVVIFRKTPQIEDGDKNNVPFVYQATNFMQDQTIIGFNTLSSEVKDYKNTASTLLDERGIKDFDSAKDSIKNSVNNNSASLASKIKNIKNNTKAYTEEASAFLQDKGGSLVTKIKDDSKAYLD